MIKVCTVLSLRRATATWQSQKHIPDNFPFKWDDEKDLLVPVLIPVARQKFAAMNQSVNNNGRCPYFCTKIGIQLSKLGSALAATREKTEIGREGLKALLRIGKDTILINCSRDN